MRQLESRGIDPVAYLRATGCAAPSSSSGSATRHAIRSARELVLEAVAEKLGIEVTDDDIRADLLEEGESEEDVDEFMEAGGADRVRDDLRLKKAVDRVAAEVKPIAKELAQARESIWTPGKDEGRRPERNSGHQASKEAVR